MRNFVYSACGVEVSFECADRKQADEIAAGVVFGATFLRDEPVDDGTIPLTLQDGRTYIAHSDDVDATLKKAMIEIYGRDGLPIIICDGCST
jgi:hypothetical protein